MLLCPCGQRSVTHELFHLWLLLWQLCLPSPPPFTTLLSIWSSSPTFASSSVGMLPSAEEQSVGVCVSTAPHRRELAGNLTSKKTATPQDCQMGYRRIMVPADTAHALKQPLAPEETLQTTAPSRLPGY